MSLFFLVGFMGAGKTTIGKALAKEWNLPFLDTDDLFRDEYQMTTGQYISRYGLAKFRPEEQATLQRLISGSRNAIVATGGGLPVYPGNMEMMLASGTVIHLKLSLEQISARLSPDELAKRPVWTSKTSEELQALYEERIPIYDRAQLIIDASSSVEQIVRQLTCWNTQQGL